MSLLDGFKMMSVLYLCVPAGCGRISSHSSINLTSKHISGRLVKLGNAGLGAVSQHSACCSQGSPGAKRCQSSARGALGCRFAWDSLNTSGISFCCSSCLCVCCEGCGDWHRLCSCRSDQSFPLLLLCGVLPDGCSFSLFFPGTFAERWQSSLRTPP